MKHERHNDTVWTGFSLLHLLPVAYVQYVPICFSWGPVTIELNNKRVSGDLKLSP